MKILVIEDRKELCDLIKRGLAEEGYAVDGVLTGEDGEDLLSEFPYDLIILDIVLPGKDGLLVCKSLREKRLATPILLLTVKNSAEDKVKGLDSGADYYLTKPFDFEELYAVVRSLLRREPTIASTRITIGEIVIDTISKEVFSDGRAIEMTAREFAILEYLARRPNRAVTRTMIEQHVWNMDTITGPNVVDVYICRLREKLDRPGKESIIETVRGAGYRLKSGETNGKCQS